MLVQNVRRTISTAVARVLPRATMVVMAQRRFRVKWWHGLIAFVVCLPLSGLVIAKIAREDGKARYEAAVAARQALGRPATVADVIALAPTVDPVLQEAWHAWQQGYLRMKHVPDPNLSPQWERWVAGVAELAPEIHDWVEGRREVFAPARLLVRNPELVISGFGFVAADLPPQRQGILNTSALRIANLLAVRDFARWLSYESVLANDPFPALSDLDALLQALDPPITLIDAMIAVAVSDIRDTAVFALAWRDRLPAEYRAAWLDEAPMHVHWIARGLEGEIALLWAGMANSLSDGLLFDVGSSRAWWWSWSGWQLWTQGYTECSIAVDWLGAWCDRLDNRRPDVLTLPTSGDFAPGVLTAMALVNCPESALTALQAAARHQQFRLAVRLLSLPPDELPADRAELERRLADPTALNAGGDALALTYERLGPDRFRLSVDPHAPGPNLVVDPGRIADLGKAVGTPASAEPYVLGSGKVEVSLPGTVAPAKPSSP